MKTRYLTGASGKRNSHAHARRETQKSAIRKMAGSGSVAISASGVRFVTVAAQTAWPSSRQNIEHEVDVAIRGQIDSSFIERIRDGSGVSNPIPYCRLCVQSER
jgi:hypothetical protein